ncbi:putative ribonuclease H-like domain-containing protein [Tanacetum coccineum]|uniref:Ribonuclease H-like domain-containing protein n=1 Tax=Tanacetum coccineum TaxID=301880 RepID=A0ABQ5IW13_9ASTR
MYSFNLENIVPSGGLACLIAKATIDESNKWHRRLGHVNFKNLNKLVKGNLVRGLPLKIFQNDHTCVACQKGKQHKASYINEYTTCKIRRTKLTNCRVLQEAIKMQVQKTLLMQGRISEKEDELLRLTLYLPIWSSYSSTVMRSIAKDAGDAPYKHPDLKTNGKPVDKEDQVFLDELERLKRQEKDANDAAEALRKEFAQQTEDLLLQAGAAKPSSTNIVNTASTPVSTASTDSDLPNPDQDDSEIPALEDIYQHPTDGIFTNSSYDDEGAVADFTNLETVVNVSPIPTSRINSFHPSTLILGDPQSAVQTRSKVTKSSGAHAFKKISEALEDRKVRVDQSKIAAGIKIQKVRIHVDCLKGRNKWNKNKKVAGWKPLNLFSSLFLLHGIIVYQMDVKNAFLLRKNCMNVAIVSQSTPSSLLDFSNKYPQRKLQGVKALYWAYHKLQEPGMPTLSTFCMQHGYRRVTIDKTLFIKKDKHDIILVQVYVDDIIFGSTKRTWCNEFEALIKGRFQTSSMGELTFFLGLQVKQKADVQPIETSEAFSQAMNYFKGLILSFAVRAVLGFQSLPKTSHLSVVKRIFKMSAKSKMINNVRYITAKVAGKPVSISEASIRNDLLFDDADGIDSLPNQAIFDAIQLMGYEGNLIVLTFNKALFSPQWSRYSNSIEVHGGATSARPSEPQPTPSPPYPSKAHVEPPSDPSPRPSPTPHIPDSILESSDGNQGGHSSSDKSLLGNEALEGTTQEAQEASQTYYHTPQSMDEECFLNAKIGRKEILKENLGAKRVCIQTGEEVCQRDGLNKEMENADAEVSTEDVLSTAQEKVSIDTPKVSTDGSKVSTDKEKVSTDTPKVSTDGSKVSTDKEKDSTERTDEGTDDQTEGRRATQTILTTQTPTSTMFGDDETIAQVLLNMSQAKAVSREKEKGIDPKDKRKKKIEEEDESETESKGIPEAEKKFKQLASDEEMARKLQENWETEEEGKRLAEEEATNDALIRKL